MSLTFVTVMRSGGAYDHTWTQRLCRQVRNHLQPDQIVCLTDDFNGGAPIMCAPFEAVRLVPLPQPWPGWFSKLNLWAPGLFEGPVLYVDLDSLILKPIPDLEAKIVAGGRLLLLDDFFAPHRAATGVMAWVPCAETEAIHAEFCRRPVCKPGWSNGDGSIVGQYVHRGLQPLFPGVFQSWKIQEKLRQPVTGSVLCFHGQPKNDSFPPDHWVTKAWKGMPNTAVSQPGEKQPQ